MSCKENKPCRGTPQTFSKVLENGFANLVQCYVNKDDIHMLVIGVHWKVGEIDENANIVDMLEALSEIAKSDVMDDYVKDHTGGYLSHDIMLGKCVMQDENGGCMLNDLDINLESCCMNKCETTSSYIKLWDNDLGKSVVNRWKELVKYKEEEDFG